MVGANWVERRRNITSAKIVKEIGFVKCRKKNFNGVNNALETYKHQ